MRLDAVSLALPSRKLTNEDVVGYIRAESRTTFVGDLDRTLARVTSLLRYAGARSRYWTDPGDRPLDLLVRAVDDALARAQCELTDIDLVISAGIDRGFLEPANAYFMADALGMTRVQCFDVVDACNGWTRAAQVASALMRAGQCRRALVINAEFPMLQDGVIFPGLFRLRAAEELEWSFAGFTLGEGVTASIFSVDAEREWEFQVTARPELADLCSVPLEGLDRYCKPSDRVGRNGVKQFTSFSGQMFSQAKLEVLALFEQLRAPLSEVSIIIPHAATRRDWEDGAAALGIRDRLYHVFPRCGNLASASVPAGIALAVADGRVHRGDRIVGCVASAGMTYALSSFVY